MSLKVRRSILAPMRTTFSAEFAHVQINTTTTPPNIRWLTASLQRDARRTFDASLFDLVLFPAAVQRHQREPGAVLLVVIVQGVIPPRAVLFLFRHQDAREVVLVKRPVFFRQKLNAL